MAFCSRGPGAGFVEEGEVGVGVNVSARGAVEGWEVRNARFGCGGWVDVLFVVEGEGGGERMVLRWLIRRAFRWFCLRRAWLSFRVSWTLRRRMRVDSGVAAVSGRGRWRPCIS